MKFFQFGYQLLPKNTLSPIPITTLSCKNGSKKRSFSQAISTAHMFVSVMETCPDVETLRKLHACVLAQGLGSHIYLGSNLLKFYAGFGCLTESRKLFDIVINKNTSLWNSIIVGYFRNGYFHQVLELYSKMKKGRIGIDSSALTFGFKSCAELGSVEFGRGIHVDVFKFGFDGDKFVGSSLIRVYAKCGRMEDALQVFDEMPERDVITYTAMITGCAQSYGQFTGEAFRIAHCMQKEKLAPNRVTLVSLLQAATQLKALDRGKSIHSYAIRREMDRGDEVIETSLLDMYIKCGDLNSVGSVFRRVEKMTVASWNVMIAGQVQCGESYEALNLFYLMIEKDYEPDMITFANALLACADLRCLRRGMNIHGYVIRRETRLDLVATTALIDMYSKCSSMDKAEELFDRMEVRDIISCNVMMAAYLQSGFAAKVFVTFSRLVEMGFKPNTATILNLLSASCDLLDIRKGKMIHGYIVRQGFESNLELVNQILHMYAKFGQLDTAKEIFNRITNRDLVSWTSMMTGYAHNGHADEALSLFWSMQEAREEPDSVTLISLLLAFSQLGSLKQAKEIHGYIYRMRLETDITVINPLVMTYAKCGRPDLAKFLFDNMTERGIATWNTIIGSCGMNGNGKEALALFYRMQEEKIKPDELTFTSVLSACSHSGLVEEGKQIFHAMIDEHFIPPREEHYSCMVDLLGRAGHLEEAYDFVNSLPLKQSASALGALLGACRVHRNTELGERVGKKLLDLEPQNASVYILISNIYADAGKWDSVQRIRAMAKERSLRKVQGYSSVESNKQVFGT